ncbi:hypothetical protein FOC1_h10016745, partial [Fusarium oxysporum f. sp. cubense race 1]
MSWWGSSYVWLQYQYPDQQQTRDRAQTNSKANTQPSIAHCHSGSRPVIQDRGGQWASIEALSGSLTYARQHALVPDLDVLVT